MGKKIVLRESQLKRLLQYNTKQKLKESLEDLEPVDYNMGKDGDENQLPNPPQEINLDIEEGDYYEGDYYEDDSMSAEIDMETGITMEDDYSLNEGQKELKSTFNKYMGNPIIESLSSKIK